MLTVFATAGAGSTQVIVAVSAGSPKSNWPLLFRSTQARTESAPSCTPFQLTAAVPPALVVAWPRPALTPVIVKRIGVFVAAPPSRSLTVAVMPVAAPGVLLADFGASVSVVG